MKEKDYIRYRKLKALLTGLCFYVCRLFPINQKLISVCTFEGKGGFGCNPKYVVKGLHERDKEYQFVWFVNKNACEKEFPEYIKKVVNNPINRAYYLSRSKIWIDNYRKPYGTKKRKNQYYINLNHYTIGIKSTGLLRGQGFSEMAYLVSKSDSDMIDALIIDSTWCEQCFDKAMVYDGKMLKTGSPRCDVLYGDRSVYKEVFRKKYNIPENAKVIMYAPTFREGAKDGKRFVYSENWTLDFERLIKCFERKFGGIWYICVRVHPQLATMSDEYKNEQIGDRIINENTADDMYELLAGMDAYITDYSSAVFEAGLAKIPSFIYADDIERYESDRGSLMWNLSGESREHITNNKAFTPQIDAELPFSIAVDNDELEYNITKFDTELYNKKIDIFCQELGVLFDGRASKRVADVIENNL